MSMSLAFCSSCEHYELYGESRTKIRGQIISKVVPKPKFCAKCGSNMLYACPSCGATRRSIEDKFCTNCGKPYK